MGSIRTKRVFEDTCLGPLALVVLQGEMGLGQTLVSLMRYSHLYLSGFMVFNVKRPMQLMLFTSSDPPSMSELVALALCLVSAILAIMMCEHS